MHIHGLDEFTGRTAVDPESTGSTTSGGSDPGSAVGPRIVARLPGPTTAYSIGTDGDGSTVLWCSLDVDGVGQAMGGDTARGGVTFDHKATRSRMAPNYAVQKNTLAEINRRNREAWAR